MRGGRERRDCGLLCVLFGESAAKGRRGVGRFKVGVAVWCVCRSCGVPMR